MTRRRALIPRLHKSPTATTRAAGLVGGALIMAIAGVLGGCSRLQWMPPASQSVSQEPEVKVRQVPRVKAQVPDRTVQKPAREPAAAVPDRSAPAVTAPIAPSPSRRAGGRRAGRSAKVAPRRSVARRSETAPRPVERRPEPPRRNVTRRGESPAQRVARSPEPPRRRVVRREKTSGRRVVHRAPPERRVAVRGGPVALNGRAYRLQQQGRHREAEPLLRQALRKKPGYAYAQYNLGWSLVRQGRAREALDPLKRTSARQPRRWEPHARLAEAYERLGDHEKAAYHRSRSRSLRSGRSKRAGDRASVAPSPPVGPGAQPQVKVMLSDVAAMQSTDRLEAKYLELRQESRLATTAAPTETK
jgi:hypothetical protein